MADQDTAERTRRRFARRQWTRRWLAWKPVVAVVALAALVGVGIWLVWFSSVLSVQGVEVTGLRQLKPAQIRSAARVPVGDPLASVDLDRIRTRVESLAPVRSADVSRQWPDQVLITVEERTAVAVVEIAGQLHGMDEDGVVFEDLQQAPPGLPRVVTGSSTGSDALHEAALVVAALPEDLRTKVDHVEVRTVDEISLELKDGRVVVWGSAADSDEKADVLGVLLKQPGRRFDVSVPSQVTTSP